jgi:Cft2 family RNA processing exonuclease
MMTEHTLSNIFARRILGDASQHLFFVGYSDPDSPSARIRKASPGDEIMLDKDHPAISLKCDVREFSFSAHTNRETIRNYAALLRPSKILLVHGDRPALDWFQLALFRELGGTEVIVPESGRSYSLE